MTAPVDSDQLIELLDRQFAYVRSLSGPTKLVRLRRLLGFLENEPRLLGLLQDFASEAETELKTYEGVARQIAGALLQMWSENESVVRKALEGQDDGGFGYGSFDGFRGRLEGWSASWSDLVDGESVDRFRDSFRALEHWTKCITDVGTVDKAIADAMHGVRNSSSRLRDLHEFYLREFREWAQSSPWLAHHVLLLSGAFTNPVPPPEGDLVAWVEFSRARKAANEFHSLHSLGDGQAIAKTVTVDDSAGLLHEELRARVVLGRSRLALVRRYAARCEQFDAERLRGICDEDSRRAERHLTDDFARYLFDQGLMPFTEASVSGLRPDVIELSGGSLFYVEAKQINEKNPRAKVTLAFHQCWETWARLQQKFRLDEAFLLIFRRGGPSVVLPASIRSGARVLHAVCVDIASPRQSGSRAAAPPMEFSEAELLGRKNETLK